MKNQSHGGVVGWFIVAIIALLIALLILFGNTSASALHGKGGPISGPAATTTPVCPPSWEARAPLPRGVMGSSAAVSGGYVYSMGGRDFTYNNISTTQRYDPETDSWTALAPMPVERNWASAAALGDYIYVVNGSEGGGALDTVFRYSISADAWQVITPTIGHTYGPAVVALNNEIYRIGGLDQNGVFTSSVEVLDRGFVAPLPIGRAWGMAVVLDGYIYFAGGAGKLGEGAFSNKTFRYDPAADKWSDAAIADLPEPKAYSAAGVLDGKFVVAGGGDDYSTVWAWNPQTDAWESLPPLLYPRLNMPGAVVNNVMHVLGGINDSLPIAEHQQYDPHACDPPTTTPTVSPTPIACAIQFTDVPPGSTFYSFVHCLACQGIINGYPCGGAGEPCDPGQNPYFRPGSDVTRGQIAKIALLASGHITDPVIGQTFEDVPPGSTFYEYVERLAVRGVSQGYVCGGAGEPCVPPGNRPYFRPSATASRGQLTKIVSELAGFTDPPVGQTFEDVPPASTFYTYTQRLTSRSIMSGYPCGSPEPCVPPDNRPYFRPAANVTRGQTSKIVSNTFFPDCALAR